MQWERTIKLSICKILSARLLGPLDLYAFTCHHWATSYHNTSCNGASCVVLQWGMHEMWMKVKNGFEMKINHIDCSSHSLLFVGILRSFGWSKHSSFCVIFNILYSLLLDIDWKRGIAYAMSYTHAGAIQLLLSLYFVLGYQPFLFIHYLWLVSITYSMWHGYIIDSFYLSNKESGLTMWMQDWKYTAVVCNSVLCVNMLTFTG